MKASPIFHNIRCKQGHIGKRHFRNKFEFEKGINIALIKFCIYDWENDKMLPAYDEKELDYSYRLKIYDVEKREIGYMILFWEEYSTLMDKWGEQLS